MKYFLSLFVLLFALVSCGREDDNYDLESIAGNWQQQSRTLVLDGSTENPSETGIAITLILNTDKTYAVLYNGSAVSSGDYVIKKERYLTDESERSIIEFSSYPKRIIESSSSNELVLMDYNADVYREVYTK